MPVTALPKYGLLVVVAISPAFLSDTTRAAEGEPVAVIRLPGNGIMIESMWNLSVTIADAGSEPDASQTGASTHGRDGVDLVRNGGDSHSTTNRVRVAIDDATSLNHIVSREPNQPQATWTPRVANKQLLGHQAGVSCAQGIVLVEVDGLKIGHLSSASLSADQDNLIKGCDALIYDGDATDNEKAEELANENSVALLILKSAREGAPYQMINGNTLALRAGTERTANTRLIVLSDEPTALPAELAKLFERKEASCRASQRVFQPLSVAQMNFQPANGSHTPRWNTEHMMGRELLFFSQIFHALDPTIPIMDLNPKQMPPDYQMKHSDWTGAEEARQMSRVADFTRRFAYLLADLPLDKKPKGSGWTPRRLMLQMERHYSEHTANVKKKFDLPGWPKE